MTTRFAKKKLGENGIKNMTAEKLKECISDYSEKYNSQFHIKNILIQPVQPPLNSADKKVINFYRQCFGRGESRHHGYLKWFGYNYIKQHAFEIIDLEIVCEKQLYLPNVLYWKNKMEKAYGRLLHKEEETFIGWNAYPLKHGPMFWIQESDISCRGSFIIECGVTSTMSLTMPLITQAVSKVIWLPYPNMDDRNSEWSDFETPLKGFIVSKSG